MKLASDSLRLMAKKRVFRVVACLIAAAATLLAATVGTQDAIANGDTRSLTFFHTHTRESTTITFRRNGQYDEQALSQLNWFLRDWRTDKPTKMDPRLFDVLWEVYREVGSEQPINVISAYRSPETNGMLHRRSRAVSEHSQHMLGKAMDIRLPDVETARLRAVAMRLQYGGVGYYPSEAFVHIDTGNVRAWPRMSQEQLVRLFPNGKTLHLPSSGKPLPGYEEAKAEILTRNAALAQQASAGGGSIGSILASLFGQRTPEPPAPLDRSTLTASTKIASASPEGMETVSIPLPPRRPDERQVALIDAAPPEDVESAPVTVASADQAIIPMPDFDIPQGEKSAVRVLFDPNTIVFDLGFSSRSKDELSVTHFTGPAVKPLPVLRLANVDL